MSDLNFDGLDLNLLVALDALLRERNVTRAAVRMGISQSGMSHKLRHLRDHFDDPLLAPGRNGLVLTERAEALSGPLRAALQQLARAIRPPEPFDPGSSERRFIIAGADYGAFLLMPDVMRQISEIGPRIEIVLEPYGTNLAERLEAGTTHLAVRPHVINAAGMKIRKVSTEDFVVVTRDDHPGIGRRLTLRCYARLPHLLISPGGGLLGVVDQLLAKRSLQRHIALRIGHFVSAPFIVAESNLVWTAPVGLARRAQKYVRLALHKPPMAIPPVVSFMMWHERFQDDPGHQWLRGLVVDAMDTLNLEL